MREWYCLDTNKIVDIISGEPPTKKLESMIDRECFVVYIRENDVWNKWKHETNYHWFLGNLSKMSRIVNKNNPLELIKPFDQINTISIGYDVIQSTYYDVLEMYLDHMEDASICDCKERDIVKQWFKKKHYNLDKFYEYYDKIINQLNYTSDNINKPKKSKIQLGWPNKTRLKKIKNKYESNFSVFQDIWILANAVALYQHTKDKINLITSDSDLLCFKEYVLKKFKVQISKTWN